MLLFQKRFHSGLIDGSIDLTFRRWQKPHVKVGGRYRVHPIGVVEVDAVAVVALAQIRDAEARRAGFTDVDELKTWLEAPVVTRDGVIEREPLGENATLYRVQLRHAGDGDRVEIALDDALGPDDIAAIAKRLERLDRPKRWSAKTLALIAEHPRVAASQLAKKVRRETEPFKVDVRKLKRLGLTMSFEVGYELSPRGKAFVAARAQLTKRSQAKPRRKR